MTKLQLLKNKALNYELLEKNGRNHERRKYMHELLNKELLEELLIQEGYSALYICTSILKPLKIKIDAGQIINFAKKYGIKTRTLKESANSLFVRDRFKQTCLINFGSENCLSKNTSVYNKRNESVKEKYGVENVFQLKDVKEKSSKTLFEKYGVHHQIEMPFRHRNNGKRSKIQILVEKYLTSIDISFDIEIGKIFRKFNDDLQKIYSPVVDILIESKKIIIEIYGDKWHANPLLYKDQDLIVTWDGKKTASEIREKDYLRKKQLESFGYKVVEIWETDIRKNFSKVEDIINESLQDKINSKN